MGGRGVEIGRGYLNMIYSTSLWAHFAVLGASIPQPVNPWAAYKVGRPDFYVVRSFFFQGKTWFRGRPRGHTRWVMQFLWSIRPRPWITSRLDAPQTPFWGGYNLIFSIFQPFETRSRVKNDLLRPAPGVIPDGLCISKTNSTTGLKNMGVRRPSDPV